VLCSARHAAAADEATIIENIPHRFISAAQQPEVVQHHMDGDIKGWLARSQRGMVTHDALHDGMIRIDLTLTPDRDAMKKLLCIIAAVMALIVASSTAMAEPKKRSLSDKATHRMKSPQPSNRVPTYEDRLREYQELKREGWYKEDKA
jgi:hypothetical protein